MATPRSVASFSSPLIAIDLGALCVVEVTREALELGARAARRHQRAQHERLLVMHDHVLQELDVGRGVEPALHRLRVGRRARVVTGSLVCVLRRVRAARAERGGCDEQHAHAHFAGVDECGLVRFDE